MIDADPARRTRSAKLEKSACRSTSATACAAWRASAATSTCSAARWPPPSARIPYEIQDVEDLEPARGAARLLRPADGAGAGHRPDRQRQVDDARGAGQATSPTDGRCTSSPSRTRSSSCSPTASRRSRSARSAPTRRASPRRCATSLRQDPDVIMVGEMRDPETDRHRDHRRRDRPPGVLDPAHQQRRRRPSTASSTPSRPTSRTRSARSSPRCSRAWSR